LHLDGEVIRCIAMRDGYSLAFHIMVIVPDSSQSPTKKSIRVLIVD